ncbi:hypothetical protein LCGC14_2079000 [marine sediment metagenome]|uniref:Uncharacterized protein n=1 Tax=marine sediment metagenome TaxID=412755 RepID=A0A0F9EGC9_9ZZZZ
MLRRPPNDIAPLPDLPTLDLGPDHAPLLEVRPMRRLVAGYLVGLATAASLISVGLVIGSVLVGLALGLLWARARARSRRAPEPRIELTTQEYDEIRDPAEHVAALARVDLVVYAEEDYERQPPFLKVPADTLDALVVVAPDLLVIVAEGQYPVVPNLGDPGLGVVVLPPGPRIHIALERRE